jgi:alpha-tubulin suppressor-like RCC1 family protein
LTGRGDRGQLGLGRGVLITKHFEIIKSLPKHLTAIAAGESHTAIVDSHGEIYVFGDGKHSKLDNETHSNKFKPYFLDKFEGYQVFKVVCGGCQTIILAQKKSTESMN